MGGKGRRGRGGVGGRHRDTSVREEHRDGRWGKRLGSVRELSARR